MSHESKFDKWKQLADQNCKDCISDSKELGELICSIRRAEYDTGCCVGQIQNILNGKIPTADKAEAIMGVLSEVCTDCKEAKMNLLDCQPPLICVVANFRKIGEGR